MNLMLKHILAQVQFNKKCDTLVHKMKTEFIVTFFRLYAAASSSKLSKKKNHRWKVQKVPLITECCSAHTTGTVHSPLCMP